MTTAQNNSLIVTLAEKLTSKSVEPQLVTEILEVIAKGLNFDCGFIYSVDNAGNCFMKEHWETHTISLCESFPSDLLDKEYLARLAAEEIVYLEVGHGLSEQELTLLDLFSVESLAISTAVDENMRVFGMIVFANTSPKEELSEANKKTFSILLNMLINYVGKRMYVNKLSFAKTALESILDNTGIDIYVNDFQTHDVLYVNKSMAAPYGGIEKFMGSKCWQTLFPSQGGPCKFCPQKKLLDHNGEPSRIYTWDYQRAFDGSWFRVFSAAFRWVDGRLAHVVSSADITDNKRNEELIQYLANYDALTRLPNRRMLVSECENRIAKKQAGEKFHLLFFDIDGFKAINDNFGHDTGDEFLVQLGEFFMSIPMLKDHIYRHGGDEFVALLDGNATPANINTLSGFIHGRFEKPWKLKNGDVYCNTSIGVAAFPEDGATAEELLRKADQAMYQIKKCGGAGLKFYAEKN